MPPQAVTDRMVCDALGRLMDEHFGATWRDMISQDEALKVEPMTQAAINHAGERAVSETEEKVAQAMESATAWRFDGILREFPPIKPIHAWFVWPLHVIDDSGILADVMADGQQRPKGNQRRESKRDKLDAELAEFAMLFDTMAMASDDGAVNADELAERLKTTKKRIYYLVRKSGEFETNGSIIIRKKENDREN